MLLLYQTGSIKIGEVVRYTVTYTPAHDRILPSPSNLHLRIRNSTAIALRAAFIHGPYTLYCAAYPSTFHPDQKFENPRTLGVPEFEPNLKAGGTFTTKLAVPEDVRKTAGTADRHGRSPGRDEEEIKSVSWIIEVSSQVIFSTSAAVHYEILLSRDEKSLTLGFANPLTGGGSPTPIPGQVSDHQQIHGAKDGHHNVQRKGIYSRAVRLRVDDTASLWNTPKMPEWDDTHRHMGKETSKYAPTEIVIEGEEKDQSQGKPKRQKNVHLVVLTHGLHSNLGADMLYMKESIDATARQAKVDAKARRAKRRQEEREKAAESGQSHDKHHDNERKNDGGVKHPTEQREDDLDEEEDDEEIIVRGFSGNATRTERGIKYLGKRLAKYVLQMTYPDQPYRPITKKTTTEAISHALRPSYTTTADPSGPQTHNHSSIYKDPYKNKELPYKITSISFIAHSLGGLIQTYAVAYIQKHSPEFFDHIKPINFIALASPFLGLSNENPLYVKAALDFGLVGRTGQDLGLTWRAPTIARSGWGAIVGGIGESAHKKIDGETPPETKPLLRILPTGPAHIVLKKFRNRTVYSNVVNDGIVPLRTSCLLFLDWQGLGRVEKARRENGLVGTVAGWGWAELTGQNTVSPMARTFSEGNASASDNENGGENTPTRQGHGADVPQPPPSAVEDDNRSIRSLNREGRPTSSRRSSTGSDPGVSKVQNVNIEGPFASFVKFFQPTPSPNPHKYVTKQTRVYRRSQTLRIDSQESASVPTSSRNLTSPGGHHHRKATNGDSDHEDFDKLSAPPKTTFFEAAGDLLKPPLPSVEFLISPESRARTIFHDRVYHPTDIPPPPLKKRPTGSLLARRRSSSAFGSNGATEMMTPTVPRAESTLSSQDYDDTKNTNPDKDPRDVVDGSAMKVEEKIARAYHRDLSWRKVLVRLEPDAHNNIIVRRMFANAYGWPVVKHLCDTHFSDAAVANIRDENESNQERAKEENTAPDQNGSETKDNDSIQMLRRSDRTDSEVLEATDEVPALHSTPRPGGLGRALSKGMVYERPNAGNESEGWSERDWADSENDSDFEEPASKNSVDTTKETKSGGWNWTEAIAGRGAKSPKGTHKHEIDSFLRKGKSLVEGPAVAASGNATSARVLSSGSTEANTSGGTQLGDVSPTDTRRQTVAGPQNS
ncbi:putative serine esterase-domain-containing protein [Tricladium varicosporioides]|nr:putative serine esterase-domain-containing protein [Hymenoscyphus varicosporioides]